MSTISAKSMLHSSTNIQNLSDEDNQTDQLALIFAALFGSALENKDLDTDSSFTHGKHEENQFKNLIENNVDENPEIDKSALAFHAQSHAMISRKSNRFDNETPVELDEVAPLIDEGDAQVIANPLILDEKISEEKTAFSNGSKASASEARVPSGRKQIPDQSFLNEVHDFLPKDRGKSKDSVTQGMAVQQRISADGNEEFAGQLTLKTRDFSKSQAPGHSTNGARVLDAPISTELRNSTLFPDSASAQDEGVFQVNAGTSQTTSNLLSEKNLMEATRSALNALSINTGQSNNQAGGQFSQESNSTKTNSGQMTNEAAMEMLDMAQDNWTEMLLQRVKRGFNTGKEALEFQLNPRNLGKMRISLLMQNDRATVQILTETASAAHLIGENEGRLAQLMESSGLKLGTLNSSLNQQAGSDSFGKQNGQKDENSISQKKTSDKNQESRETDSVSNELRKTENLINIQA